MQAEKAKKPNQDTEQLNQYFKIYRTTLQMLSDRGYTLAEEILKDHELGGFDEFENKYQESKKLKIINQSTDRIVSRIDDIIVYEDNLPSTAVLFLGDTKINDEIILSLPGIVGTKDESSITKGGKRITRFIIIIEGDPDSDKGVMKKTKELIAKHCEDFKQTMRFAKTGHFDQIQGAYIEIFNKDELMVNITKHKLVPRHIPISDDEIKELKEKYKIELTHLPKILLTDPVTRYFGLLQSQVFKIIRDSETAGKYITYRVVT